MVNKTVDWTKPVDEIEPETRAYIKSRIEQVLSEILSDKHGCTVRLRFEKREEVRSSE